MASEKSGGGFGCLLVIGIAVFFKKSGLRATGRTLEVTLLL